MSWVFTPTIVEQCPYVRMGLLSKLKRTVELGNIMDEGTWDKEITERSAPLSIMKIMGFCKATPGNNKTEACSGNAPAQAHDLWVSRK